MITEYKIFPETPPCPKCKNPMSASDVIPTMPTTGFDQDEVVYKCKECGVEVKRVIDRQRTEPIILGQ
jgi:uncharacterized protein with PIN domain